MSKLGIIAGGGILPLRLLEKCQSSGREFYLIGLQGQIDENLFKQYSYDVIRMGAVGKAIDLLRQNNVNEIVMAGNVNRPSMAALRPDMKAVKILAKSGNMAIVSRGDDGLIKEIVKYLEKDEGFRIISVDSILGENKFISGILGDVEPDNNSKKDIIRGVSALKMIASADIGQAIVVEDQAIIAVEAIEGTAKMLERCNDLKLNQIPSGVLVKIRKDNQETRVDMPTIGCDTIKQIVAAGLLGIAFDAGGMIIIDKDKVITAANEAGIFITAIDVD